eukprot:TRINITY_DN7207_c0_g1_i1.p1 TRINITY_DN7207_c0_g1~~TRINITY_DN7207_c0_g1_i1.p1  ORF type:complete len:1014 (-),score=199.83 TRINITY_DN7207_c0_g1_i1:206-2896(-)
MVEIMPWEAADLEQQDPRSTQYMAWRSTLLRTGSFFFAFIVTLDVVFLLDPWQSKGRDSVLLAKVDPTYRRFFVNLEWYTWIQQISLLLASGVAVAMAILAAWHWKRMFHSRGFVLFSFVFSYAPPFVFMLLLPWRHSIDFKGIQKQICVDTVGKVGNENFENLPDPGLGLAWPGRVGILAQTLLKNYDVRLPDDFCSREPSEWAPLITKMLDQNGVLLQDDGTCQHVTETMGTLDTLVVDAIDRQNASKALVQANRTKAAVLAANATNFAAEAKSAVSEVTGGVTEVREEAALAVEKAKAAQDNAKAAARTGNVAKAQEAADDAVDAVNAAMAALNATMGLLDSAERASLAAATAAAGAAAGAANLDVPPTSTNVGTSAVALAVSSELISKGCPQYCLNCTTVCIDELVLQGSLVGLYGLGVVQGIPWTGQAARCSHCFSMDKATSCAQNCPNMSKFVAQKAILGRQGSKAGACLKVEDLRDFELIAELGVQTDYWSTLLGSAFALVSLGQLIPLAVALLFGAAKGSGIAKSVIPHSRVPEIISTSAAFFTFPFVVILAILIQCVIGNLWTLFGMISLLLAIILNMKPGKMEAMSRARLHARFQRMSIVSIICIILAIVLFIIAAATSDLVVAVYNLIKSHGLLLSEEDKRKIQGQVLWVIIQSVANFLGKSLISTVFFADGVVFLMHEFHHGEDTDSLEVQFTRARLVQDLHGIFSDPSKKDEPEELLDGDEDELVAAAANSEVTRIESLRKLLAIHAAMAEHNGRVPRPGTADVIRPGLVGSNGGAIFLPKLASAPVSVGRGEPQGSRGGDAISGRGGQSAQAGGPLVIGCGDGADGQIRLDAEAQIAMSELDKESTHRVMGWLARKLGAKSKITPGLGFLFPRGRGHPTESE